jgi:histidine decarboxylase
MNAHYKIELKNFEDKIRERAKTYIGYPAGVDYHYEELYPLLQYSLNNVGDPFVESGDMQTKGFEREVIGFFAELFNAPKNNSWGYVTGGGSEGNLYALYLARELFPQGMVYYSEATHYSVQKNVHLLGMDSIVIRSDESGEMDYDDLKETVQLHRHRPVIILANIGTTMTEAKDDIPRIREILKVHAIKSSYIHCDAALAGMYLPLLGYSAFDFSRGADSIAISGHKFIGSPITCGVVVVKKSYKDRIGRSISYIGSLDTTITGSRNGITPLFLWYVLRKWGREGLIQRANDCLSLAAYAEEALRKIGIPAWRNSLALTVVFPTPSERICHKWQLASEGGQSHLICMPGVTRGHMDAFVEDLKKQQEETKGIGGIAYQLN